MRVNWVFADGYQLDPGLDTDIIKSIGPTWGSWRTWRSCSTDNVFCHDKTKTQELIGRAFQAVCNFYVPKKYYQDLGRPMGLKLYDGDFNHETDHAEEIVILHMVAAVSDLVLMAGFDLGKIPEPEDRFQKHKLQNYHGMVRSVISNNPNVQWVLVDHKAELDKAYQNLPNLTCDEMVNVLKLLA